MTNENALLALWQATGKLEAPGDEDFDTNIELPDPLGLGKLAENGALAAQFRLAGHKKVERFHDSFAEYEQRFRDRFKAAQANLKKTQREAAQTEWSEELQAEIEAPFAPLVKVSKIAEDLLQRGVNAARVERVGRFVKEYGKDGNLLRGYEVDDAA